MALWCAKWFPRGPFTVEGGGGIDLERPVWCALQQQANPQYEDSMATVCGQWVVLTGGIEEREPTCAACRKELGLSSLRRARPL